MGYNLYDFHARQYDAQIGRFWGIDPANQFPSGYTGMGNNPANLVDPTGMGAGTPYGYNPTPGQFPRPNAYDRPPDLEAMFGENTVVWDKKKKLWMWGEGILNGDYNTDQGVGNPGASPDNYYYDKSGNVVKHEVNNNPDQFFVIVNTPTCIYASAPNQDLTENLAGGTAVTLGTQDQGAEQIDVDNSDIGISARLTFAEMRGGSDDAMTIVAESIRNRADLPPGVYESAGGSYSAIAAKFYDAAKSGNANYDAFTNPKSDYINDDGHKNTVEFSAWLRSLGAAIRAQFGSNLGQGVIFYNSSNGNFYDNNPYYQKINLPNQLNGILGLWKLAHQN